MNDTFKNLLKVFSSNIFNLLSSVIITFLLPNIFGPTDFGYWSLYLLYVSYAGFVIFGYCDGIYLKMIGTKYDNLDFPKLKFFFKILLIYLLFGVFIFLPITFLLHVEVTKWYIIICSIAGIFLACLNSFFILINQATQKYNNYAIGNIIEKLILVISVIIAIIFHIKNIMFIVFASLFGKLLTLLYYLIKNREIILSKSNKGTSLEVFDNVKIGFFLTISSIFSMLMTGLGKFFIEGNYGIEYLGYYSFVFSMFSPFTQLTDSVALILIPKLKEKINRINDLIKRTYNVICYLTPLILIFYLVGKFIILLIFKKYVNSIECFMYLCPIIIIQAKISIVYNSYFKVMRKEKQLLSVNTVSLIVYLCLLFIGSKIFNNFSSVALLTFIAFLFRDIINKIYLNRKFKLNIEVFDYSSICFAIYFILIMFKTNDALLLAILLLLTIISIYINKTKIVNLIKRGKKNVI